MPREYFCTCSQHCHNPPKKVSKSTWNKHRPFREHDAASAHFQAFLVNELNERALGQTTRRSRREAVQKERKKRQCDKGKERETNDNDTEMNVIDPGQDFAIGDFDWLEEVCMRPKTCINDI